NDTLKSSNSNIFMKLYLPVLCGLLPLLSGIGSARASSNEHSPSTLPATEVEPSSDQTSVVETQAEVKSENVEVKPQDEAQPHTSPTQLNPRDPRDWAEYCPPCGRG
ncbi:MAG: hypothetical protein AAF329_19610, partial [Cyanobacteria bacterium P01_A01_bin.17]